MINKSVVLSMALVGFSGASSAGLVTYNFSGNIVNPVTVGGNTIAGGTAFTGTFSYDQPQAGVISAFYSGTRSIFSFNSLTLTINGQTVAANPGSVGLFNNVNPPNSVPVGDSLYTFVPGLNSPNASTGSIDGITPNFIYLGFVGGSNQVFGDSSLPSNLNLSSFSSAFLGINYSPFGAGNTTSIHFLKSLSTSVVPIPGAVWFFGTGLMALLGLKSNRKNQTA